MGTPFCQESKVGRVVGKVIDDETGQPIIGASVEIVGTRLGAFTKSDGTFSIELISAGVYDISCSSVGYKTAIKKHEEIRGGAVVKLDFKLTPQPIRMSEVVCRPAVFHFLLVESSHIKCRWKN